MGGGELVLRQPEVDEAGPGDLGPRDEVGREAAAPRSPARRSSRGLARSRLARTMARLVARSPWPASRGRSSTNSTPSAPRRAATLASSARSASLTRGGLLAPAWSRPWAPAWRPASRPCQPWASDSGLTRRPAFRPRPSGALAVLAVVGDVEAAALEDQAGPARDLPGGRLAAHRALGAGLVGHLLELLEVVPFGAPVLVGRHGRSLG